MSAVRTCGEQRLVMEGAARGDLEVASGAGGACPVARVRCLQRGKEALQLRWISPTKSFPSKCFLAPTLERPSIET